MTKWFTKEEDDIIRQFGNEGLVGIHARMPWRSERAICARAYRRGIAVRHGNSVRAEYDLPSNTPPLIRQLYQAIEANRLSIHAIAKRSGVNKGVIARWRRCNPRVDLLVATLNALDLDLVIVPREGV